MRAARDLPPRDNSAMAPPGGSPSSSPWRPGAPPAGPGGIHGVGDATGNPDGRDEAPPVDIAALVRACGGREPLARALAASFLRDLEAQLTLLFAAHAGGDREQLVLLAHRFKGNLGILKAGAAHRAAQELEGAARQGGEDGLGARLEHLSAELRRAASALAAWVGG